MFGSRVEHELDLAEGKAQSDAQKRTARMMVLARWLNEKPEFKRVVGV